MSDPATVVSASPLGAGAAVLAFDVGGTDMKSALFDTTGAMIGLDRTATPVSGAGTADVVLAHVEDVAARFRHDFPDVHPAAVALIAPGIVDDERGIAVRAANLAWDRVPFRDLLTERLGLPASFSHDVRAAGDAEFRLGAARPYRDVVVLVIGTGVAAALFVNGRAHSGSGYAGEIGHSVIDPRGELCACGARGCLETVASAGAIARRYRAETSTHMPGAKEVLQRVRQGDPVASRIWDAALDALALSISQLAAVLAPDAVVIGGGLAQAGDALFLPLQERVDGLLSFHRRPVLLPALLGENAGLLGAALRARGAADLQ
ncbi:MAG: ROK family protein [Cryobacterium sp.]|uniref:ROK family protein n=1 Tax=Cryobacterium sp. TaxID=1926290 RepID=UPI00229DEEEF|nr:ROK family protein [Cryobacterium sp.]MCY7403134.1 ROK family protein [Cryobacterium sp.]